MHRFISFIFLTHLFSFVCWAAEYDHLPASEPVPEKIEYSKGPFKPTIESIKEQYQCPEWFRDAKFGIWSHWGPQCVPAMDGWYGRHMYVEGKKVYKYHLEHYGHPSEFGYKDIIVLWKAEKFDPDRLMKLYAEAGAKFFFSMAVHHDNFDLWDSKYHRWDAVNLGPKRDILGEWAAAARKYDLRFGVSEHLATSWQWWRFNKKSDRKGPKQGVPYDGNDPRYADLYYPDNHNPGKGWYAYDTPEWFRRMYFWRLRDLLDRYEPDLFYSDGGFAFGEYGRSLIAHYYNTSAAAHDGKTEVVYASKSFDDIGDAEFAQETCVEDFERGIPDKIMPFPWMTDTSIHDWFHNKHNKSSFMDAERVTHLLIDIVSKNGCLLLNFVQRADGTLVEPQEQILADLAGWMRINGEGIFGTRPWGVFGENAKLVKKGDNYRMNIDSLKYDAEDIRFTAKDGVLYAFVLGWPESGQVEIKSLAKGDGINQIESVCMLGHDGALDIVQTSQSLTAVLPQEKPCVFAYCLKIIGRNLKPAVLLSQAEKGEN